MNRTLNVVRMQLVNRMTYLWIPLIILFGSFALSLVVFALIPSTGIKISGGASAPFWYFAVVGAQALTLTFPFSQALSITRREYYLGTLLTAALTSAGLTAIFVVGAAIESATGGWGRNGYFFTLQWIWAAGPAMAALFYFSSAMLFFVVGFTGATIYKRFGMLWLTVTIIAAVALLVGVFWIVGRLDAWVAFFSWFVDIGAGGITLLLAGLVVVLAAAAFPVLRRATP